jgi:hypothetical protein
LPPPASSRNASASARAGDSQGAEARRLTLDQIDLIELNEAFAAQVLACLKRCRSTRIG